MKPKTTNGNGHRILAVCERHGITAIAVIDHDAGLREVRRIHRDPKEGDPCSRLTSTMRDLLCDHVIATIVAEPGTIAEEAVSKLGLTPKTLTLADAKATLLGQDRPRRTHQLLVAELVKRCPELKNLVTILPATGRIAMSERWRTVTVFAVALALAAHQELTGATNDSPLAVTGAFRP